MALCACRLSWISCLLWRVSNSPFSLPKERSPGVNQADRPCQTVANALSAERTHLQGVISPNSMHACMTPASSEYIYTRLVLFSVLSSSSHPTTLSQPPAQDICKQISLLLSPTPPPFFSSPLSCLSGNDDRHQPLPRGSCMYALPIHLDSFSLGFFFQFSCTSRSSAVSTRRTPPTDTEPTDSGFVVRTLHVFKQTLVEERITMNPACSSFSLMYSRAHSSPSGLEHQIQFEDQWMLATGTGSGGIIRVGQ
jgi:hypothetical protein